MCTQATVDLISEVVQERVQDSVLFTVFEISLEVQKRAKAKGEAVERHGEMKQEIHQQVGTFLNLGLYNRELRDVGAPDKAFVYYPVGSDPSTYVPLKRRDPPAPAQTPAMTVAQQIAFSALSQPVQQQRPAYTRGDNNRSTDSRGVVCVPNHLIRKLGCNPSEQIAVYGKDNDTISVTKVDPSVTPVATYTVDKDHNVRITKATLEKAGVIGTNFDFEINTDNTEVLVRKHNDQAAALAS